MLGASYKQVRAICVHLCTHLYLANVCKLACHLLPESAWTLNDGHHMPTTQTRNLNTSPITLTPTPRDLKLQVLVHVKTLAIARCARNNTLGRGDLKVTVFGNTPHLEHLNEMIIYLSAVVSICSRQSRSSLAVARGCARSAS